MQLEIITAQPATPAYPFPLLFVHGAWHGAWCWQEYFLDYFAAQGFATHALSLRGHGNSPGRQHLRWTRLREYAQDVAAVAARLPAPPVLIGHSMGGAVVQQVLAQRPAPAAVLLASVPPAGVLATTLRIAARHPLLFAKVNLKLSLYPLVATSDLAREHFFCAEMPADQVAGYAARLQDESYLGFLDMLAFGLSRPPRGQTPVLVLGAAQDRIFYPPEVAATARAYHTEAVIFPDMAHDMMLEPGWQQVADHIIAWLRTRPPAAA
ncbi:MAG: alpha/beta fold hydrolase [Caldilineales bacterium]|nr:alpha/beta fold hydrolase [Caldilineales bacterium]